ncbi:MAG TPA: bifunctional acetaldehyde-CoA/alcohol dehydrogenase [Firmicutes bacterium]|mgnify:FL=1|nr:bifunctional acetaldehyde-CoA/alcohol dehydrogenase [Bacillota bacterium]HAW99957.1 bifunctional acetaldehyde-CoA/alcohol dehydrogenase [Bacillota bacterium]
MSEKLVVQDEQSLNELIERVREAQKKYATYSQEQVDKIFRAAAMAADKARIPLAKEAVEETGMGIIEDKVIKNHFASEYIFNKYREAKTCDVIEHNEDMGYEKLAEPIGVVAAIVPTTNPTSTAIFKALICLKTRNGCIFSPHPRAKQSTIDAAKTILDAAVAAGAPEDIIGWIDVPSVQLSGALMHEADTILATGGPGMVKAAYSSGKPAIGVGPGNTPAIITDSADIKMAAASIIHSKTFDNGMICASEQSVIVMKEVYDEFKAELVKRGAYILKDNEIDSVRKTILINGSLNAKIVGQKATKIAEMSGIKVPENSRVLVGEVTSVDFSEEFAHEKLSPVLAMYKAETFEDALAKATKLVTDGGYGHTSVIYLNEVSDKERLSVFENTMKTCRILVNTPASQGGIGDIYNFMLTPSLTLGCGSWGGNSVSENVGLKHLLNIKTVAIRRENMLWFRVPEKLFFKRGCLRTALTELKDEYNKKRAFIVTDKFLYESGFTNKITDRLTELGIVSEVYSKVAPDPTLACAREGAKLMEDFRPDVIIAIGGGSPMDAAKIMWVLYEHPEANFEDMAADFMDIRKRIYKFPHMGGKAFFVAIPTTAGTGSEVTPFAIITDERDGTKYPLADYELLPKMAIVDADLMMNIPKGLTKASGIDALVHSIEAIGSTMATDFSDGMAYKAIQLIFKYLPRAYKNGANDPEAREGMANAATIAGIAFANAFLGICHSMGHKLGSYHHIPHGIAVSLVLNEVMKFNSAENPTKMGTFPQYEYPQSLRRYAHIAEVLGLSGKDDEAKLKALLKAITDLKVECDIPLTIKDAGVDEKAFLESLDQMSVDAFNDQCTGANPRYPLISEIKELYLKCYYGK